MFQDLLAKLCIYAEDIQESLLVPTNVFTFASRIRFLWLNHMQILLSKLKGIFKKILLSKFLTNSYIFFEIHSFVLRKYQP